MQCNACGQLQKKNDQFCSACGLAVAPHEKRIPRSSKNRAQKTNTPWKKIFIILGVIFGSIFLLGYFIFAILYVLNLETNERDIGYDEGGILGELNPYLEPVGSFTKPELIDSETISDEEWFSLIEYSASQNAIHSSNGNTRFPDQYNTLSAVVKIVCEDEDYYYYGSGTNMGSAGYVLTNFHVLEGSPNIQCIVGFPDASSGLVREAYWATIITDKENETGEDLAMLSVEDPVFDEESNIYGFYDRVMSGTFPYYEETDACLQVSPQLGDEIYVIGYPELSGGALTMTDGLVSSLFSADGYIITSAKISSGNSGGLAIDTRGCFVGVPTAVYVEEESEQYGEIIDVGFVYDFFDAIEDDIDEYLAQ